MENSPAGASQPPISAQCPSCGLHELVPVQLGRRSDGNWTQLDRPSVLRRARPVKTHQRVQIDVCPVCMGAWFDHGELDTLSGKLEDVTAVLAPEQTPSVRPCPHGHGPLVEQRLPGIISTPVDRCLTCGGIWLDGHERRKLAKATTSEGQGTKTERWLKRGAIWAAQVLTHLPVEVDNPARGTPWSVFALLGLLFAIFLLQVQGTVDTYEWGLVAGRVKHEGDWWTIATYMFLHGSWIHILGNAYFLYTFGDNVEHLFGRLRFVLFFVAAGLVGGFAHFVLTRATALPVVGASGCIAGVLGAYLWAFPRNHLFQVILWVQVKIPAWVYLFVWVGFHLLMANFGGEKAVGTAWWAHLGGFLVGLAVTPWMLQVRRREIGRRVRVPAVLR